MKQRYNGFFLDSLLILMWCSLALLVLLGFVFAAFPALQQWLGAQFSNERMIMGTSLVFLWSTAYRVLVKYDMTGWTLAFCYVVVQITYAGAWTQGLMRKPINIVFAPVVPSAFLAMLCVPGRYVWQRIKPLPKKRRRPRRVQEEE
jgi:hypothetical protein